MLIRALYYVVPVVPYLGVYFMVHEIPPKLLGESVVVFQISRIPASFCQTNVVRV